MEKWGRVEKNNHNPDSAQVLACTLLLLGMNFTLCKRHTYVCAHMHTRTHTHRWGLALSYIFTLTQVLLSSLV